MSQKSKSLKELVRRFGKMHGEGGDQGGMQEKDNGGKNHGKALGSRSKTPNRGGNIEYESKEMVSVCENAKRFTSETFT